MGSCGMKRSLRHNQDTRKLNPNYLTLNFTFTSTEEFFLRLLYSELCFRNNSKRSLEKSIFLKLVPIPVISIQGMLGERLFDIFTLGKDSYLSVDTFLFLMLTFSKNHNETVAALFKICDLNQNNFFSIFCETLNCTRAAARVKIEGNTEECSSMLALNMADPPASLFHSKKNPDEVIDQVFRLYANGKDVMDQEEFSEFLKAQGWLFARIKQWFRVDSWTVGIQTKLKVRDFSTGTNLIPATIVNEEDLNKELSEVFFIEDCKFKVKAEVLTIIYNTLSDERISFIFESENLCKTIKSTLRALSNYKNFKSFYKLGEKIGSGKFSAVHLCTHKSTNQIFVVKVIKRKKFDKREREMIRNEITILQHCCGVATVKLQEVFESRKQVRVVMEHIPGIDLHVKMKAGPAEEAVVKTIVREILKNLKFLHLMGVMHRDIKPDNLLVYEKNSKIRIKILDFGLSTFLLTGDKRKNQCGTLGYMAPEMLIGSYSEKIDVWAVGVLTFAYLTGKLPFYSNSDEDFCTLIKSSEPDFVMGIWERFSVEARDFTKELLNKDPESRPDCEQALLHKWING